MTKFEVLKGITDVTKFSELIFDVLKDMKTPDEVKNILSDEISEDGLRTLESIARNGYPLSLERMQ
ncbi:MAG: hypothetical protein LBQ71_02450 [Hungatella sp.]|jgi:hypothetical protein|nr:hypothetical protein [Hungatella sp.]